jgi:hypothetical protein
MKLEQRSFLSRKVFEFDQRTLTISTWDLVDGAKEWSVQLDEISHRYDARGMVVFSGGCLSLFGISALSTLLIINAGWETLLILLLIALIPIVFGRHLNLYSYFEMGTARGTISIIQTNPSREKVLEFMNGLISASKQFLIWKYGTVDPDFSQEKQVENFRWLRNNGIISDEEYENLKATLKDKIKKQP